MKKRGLPYVIFGLVLYLLFLFIETPAAWFAWGLNYYSHGAIRLDPISGSLWHGTGRLVFYYPLTVPHELGNSEWRVNPFWLFMGHVQMTWQSNAQDARLNTTIRLSSGKVELLDTEARFPAEFVGTFYPAATMISPQGQVQVLTSNLTVDQNGMAGGCDIRWFEASSGFTTVKPLGDYRLEINGSGKTANLRLTTIRGDLELTGQGQYQLSSGQIQFTGSATPRGRANELEPLLKLLGNDQGNGKRALMINNRLPIL